MVLFLMISSLWELLLLPVLRQTITTKGLKVMLLTRQSPLVPFTVLNLSLIHI